MDYLFRPAAGGILFFDSLKFSSISSSIIFTGILFQSIAPRPVQGALTDFSGKNETHSLGFDYSSYPFLKEEGVQDAREKSYPSVHLNLHQVYRGSWMEATGHTGMQFTYHPSGHSAFFFEVPEAYLATSESLGPVQIKIGRKLEQWSSLDEIWEMGIWQPRFRWDYLRPESVGLGGVFLSVHQPAVQFTVMGSPGFIPERGVQVAFENGAVTSESPWFLPPPSEISVLGHKTAVSYNLILPRVSEVVRRPGVNVQLRFGEETGPWIAAAYAYKPMNQLLLAYDGYLQLNDQGDKKATATVFPRLLYHHLNSLEAGIRQSSFRASVSALSERPVRDKTPAGWTTQEVEPALAVSPSVNFSLQGANDESAQIGLSYLRVWGGSAPDGGAGGSFVSSGGSVFESRYPFAQAAQFNLQTNLAALHPSWNWGRRINLDTRLLQDIRNQGTLLSWEMRFHPQSHLELALGADILGALGSDSHPDSALSSPSTNFIDRYRKNDRFHAGISYVF